MDSITIKSSRGQRSLTLGNRAGEYYDVEIAGDGISAMKRVYEYSPFMTPLPELFQSFATDWKGWDGERCWETIEGEFSLTATSDGRGHITLNVVISSNDLDDDWKLEAPIYLEAASLDEIARQLNEFFTDPPTSTDLS